MKRLFILFLILFPICIMAQTRPDYTAIKNKPAIYAADYGIKADGTDQTTKIQTAIDAAAATNKTLIFGYGTYSAERIVLKSGVTISGQGSGTTIKLSTVSGDGYVFVVPAYTQVTDVSIRDLIIDVNKTDHGGDIRGGIYIESTHDISNPHYSLTFENLTIKNGSFGIGIVLAYDVTVKNCRILSMYRHDAGAYKGSYGYGVALNGCYRSKIVDNLIGGSRGMIDRHCIYFSNHLLSDGPTRAFTSDSIIQGNQLYCMTDVASDAYSAAISIRSPDHIQVIGNSINGGVFAGIDAFPDYKNAAGIIIANNVICNTPLGIRFGVGDHNTATNAYRLEHALVSGNLIRNVGNKQFLGLKNESCDDLVLNSNSFVCDDGVNYAVLIGELATPTILLSVQATNNTITGFELGYRVADLTLFSDINTHFSDFTKTYGYPRLYEYVRSVANIVTRPQSSVNYWDLTGYSQIAGMRCYISSLSAEVTGSYDSIASYTWLRDSDKSRLHGTTAQRPHARAPPLGTRYYNVDTRRIETLLATTTSSIPVWE